MTRQQGGVVDDGAVFRVVNDLHGDKLGAERQNVELWACGLVLRHHLRKGLTLHPPAGELKHRNAIFLRLCGWRKKKEMDNSLKENILLVKKIKDGTPPYMWSYV